MEIPTVDQALEANGMIEQAIAYRMSYTDTVIRNQMTARINTMFDNQKAMAYNTLFGLWGVAAIITIGYGLIASIR